jgi:cell division protein FtsI (penicillin-binding protein 3)
MLDFGFGKKTGAWVNMETAGLLKEPSSWSGRTKQSVSFGQEIAVSALQIMQAASVIANDGVLVPPRIVSRIVSADGKTVKQWENETNQSRRVIKPETARAMRSYMAATATVMGTGWRAGVEDLNLAVKTGTAQYRDPFTGRYSQTDFIASCVALLPAEHPSLVLYAAVIKPKGENYGGRIAAPAIREAAELLIDYLGIPRGRNSLTDHSGTFNIPGETLPEIGSTVPRFFGLSKRTLLPLLDRRDIRVEIRGDGWVKTQSPPTGTQVTPGMVIILELE